MRPGELDELLRGGETRLVEFKGDTNDDRLVEAVVCLANGDGGWLLLGVEDDGTVVGARPRHGDHTDGARLAALVANKTTPSVAVDVEILDTRSGPVVIVGPSSSVGVLVEPGVLGWRWASSSAVLSVACG
ncbi:MAG: ATP-binding protein [Acidimicrobiales bacterium]